MSTDTDPTDPNVTHDTYHFHLDKRVIGRGGRGRVRIAWIW